jgi:hypothetical protein
MTDIQTCTVTFADGDRPMPSQAGPRRPAPGPHLR